MEMIITATFYVLGTIALATVPAVCFFGIASFLLDD
jgi:hypothetical protein